MAKRKKKSKNQDKQKSLDLSNDNSSSQTDDLSRYFEENEFDENDPDTY
jgi:hypothetical protein